MRDTAHDLGLELEWFAEVLDARITTYFKTERTGPAPLDIVPPDLRASSSRYAGLLRAHCLSVPERLILLLALVPHLRPQLFDVLWSRNQALDRGFTEFGGVQTASHGGFMPTGETAAFLVAGDDLAARFSVMRMFEDDHLFARQDILRLEPVAAGDPLLSGVVKLAGDYISRLTTGSDYPPHAGNGFPARLIETGLCWEDLVLPSFTLAQLEEVKHWLQYGQQLLHDWGMVSKLPAGFTTLFHGPPGTGKTLCACLLGKHCGCKVYKIDLSMIISKYIGETEKNLAAIFDRAEHRGWILFFDEADALFGKRTRVSDAHDRYANQEISFLLQRIEEFGGVVILASNIKANIDEAFTRRLHSFIHFPMPKPGERLRIWQGAFSPKATLDSRIDLARLSEHHELAGGAIMNVVRFASLRALSRRGTTIFLDDLEEGIRRELHKEGRSM